MHVSAAAFVSEVSLVFGCEFRPYISLMLTTVHEIVAKIVAKKQCMTHYHPTCITEISYDGLLLKSKVSGITGTQS